MSSRRDLAKATATVTLWNGVSRASGFLRVLAVGGAVGTTYLGNTYQTANLVSNVLFELLAGGLLAAVLVPAFVARFDADDEAGAVEQAGRVLGLALAGLGVIVAAGIVLRDPLMRALTLAVDDTSVRNAEVRLGTYFLWFFLPQLLLYAIGAVATALLHARRRFAAAAFAPVANNAIVIATMVVYWALRSGRPDLALSSSEKLVLAIGTSSGVLAMAVVPVVAAYRAGLRLRPRWGPWDGAMEPLLRAGAWAGGHLGFNQAIVLLTLVLANRVEGGVVAYTIAFNFFLLPHALLSNPIYTTLYPELATHAAAGDPARFAATLSGGLRLGALVLLPAAALLAVLGEPTLRLVRVGAFDASGARLAAAVLAAYALGLLGYSTFFLLTRAAYALDDVRSPTIVNAGVAAVAATLMFGGATVADGDWRVIGLGLAHSIAVSGGAAALAWRLQPGGGGGVAQGVVSAIVRCGVAAVTAAGAGLGARALLGGEGRSEALVALVVGGLSVGATYVVALRALGSPELARLPALLREAVGR